MLTRRLKNGLSVSLSAALLVGAIAAPSQGQTTENQRQQTTARGDVSARSTGIAAAWMFLTDDPNYRKIPVEWQHVNFRKVDTLLIGPLGIQDNSTFGLYKSKAKGNLAKRFRWVVARARTQNPGIKIIVSQWWGDKGRTTWGKALNTLRRPAQIQRYARTVASFFRNYQNFYGGLNGYDIDYEDNNAIPKTPRVFKRVRAALDRLERETGREYLMTVSPADHHYLRQVSGILDYAFLQTYSGSYGITTAQFRRVGFKSSQIFFGICPETDCETDSPEQAEAIFRRQGLAGIHNWRLNSDNYVYENAVQAQVFRYLHR